VLLSRTKAAEEARQEALTALGHMQSFVRDLVGQYPHLQAASCAQLEGVTSSTLSNMEDVDEVFGWGDLGLGRTFSAAASSPATTLTTAAAMMGAFQSLDSSSGRGADKLGKNHSMRFETHHELGLSSNRMFSGGLLGDLDDLMVFSAMA
ncbi:hypothetical protein HaLaN_30218, partial [Haematococcus lacustris]